MRITPDTNRQTGPDLAVGTGDVLHLVYFNDADDLIEHKTLLADDWDDVGATGWVQGTDGAGVDNFVNDAPNNAALERAASRRRQ